MPGGQQAQQRLRRRRDAGASVVGPHRVAAAGAARRGARLNQPAEMHEAVAHPSGECVECRVSDHKVLSQDMNMSDVV